MRQYTLTLEATIKPDGVTDDDFDRIVKLARLLKYSVRLRYEERDNGCFRFRVFVEIKGHNFRTLRAHIIYALIRKISIETIIRKQYDTERK